MLLVILASPRSTSQTNIREFKDVAGAFKGKGKGKGSGTDFEPCHSGTSKKKVLPTLSALVKLM